MLKSHENFHSVNGRRLILVADDEFINREILKSTLEKDYEVLTAADGLEALRLIRENRETLSLVLLDLMMPGMPGLDLLREVKNDQTLKSIPVIVMTADQSSEIESLNVGAIDFIPKPYPQADVILARVRRIIELSEDRQIIQVTERDTVTGLYNKDYFFRYADQFDQFHKDTEMDAIMVDIYHFRMINERYGKTYGDEVLRDIGSRLRLAVGEKGGMVCRMEGDTFLIYCPHYGDYSEIIDTVMSGRADDTFAKRIRLRMGIYSNVDKSIDIERRFDRAKMASDTIRSSFTRSYAIYDNNLHESEMFAEQLIEDFRTAISEGQFTVFYQPKFDIRHDIPVLASAEALVRWKHPTLGMISPGVFIPLFEENGLIQDLDTYVWKMAAAQIKDWKDRFGISIPVSVNVSRIDMYDPDIVENFQALMERYGLTSNEFLLEITESAYTEDSAQIISTVNRLRSLGFQIEMDDFGTGYSSLNMISSLPIDALKLDMKFIRNAFSEGHDTRMIEVIIDIADYLGVPVIAEGVETEDQLLALKKMGCDIVQGYYFSKPLPPSEYETFVEEKKKRLEDAPIKESAEIKDESAEITAYTKIAHALTSGFECIYYVNTVSGHYVQFSSQGRYEDLQIERSGRDFFSDTAKNVPKVVYSEDVERVLISMQKEALLAQLIGGEHFSMTYRLVIDGEPVYYNLRAAGTGTNDSSHIVIGICNMEHDVLQAIDDSERDRHNREFSGIAQALSSDFEHIYYIDTETGAYKIFKSQGSLESLNIGHTGGDFFEDCKKNIADLVCPGDRDKLSRAMERGALLGEIGKGHPLSLVFRLMIGGEPVFYRLKAIPTSDDDHHIIIGVSNIDEEMTDERRREAADDGSVSYFSIAQALAADYFCIYYVNTESGSFIEYSAHDDYRSLELMKSGDDFFGLTRKNIIRVVHQDDHERLLSAFTKENILNQISESGAFTLEYRIMLGGKPTFVMLKASRMPDAKDPHIVIGISNIDAQIRRDKELWAAREKANRDALTGVKSKHAYLEAEEKCDLLIAAGENQPFAVAVCDVNGLKNINDNHGHQAGDGLIRDAARIICRIFDHSPVYRVGGDEFVVIMRGEDYEHRDELMAKMLESNEKSMSSDGVIIASGMSAFIPGRDRCLSEVFVRADEAMYENKSSLKETR